MNVTALLCMRLSMVLVEMNALFRLKLDIPTILSRGFSSPRNSILQPDFVCMMWIKSYLQLNTNVGTFIQTCVTLETPDVSKTMAAKSKSMGLKSQ